jgi:hypothetical protein
MILGLGLGLGFRVQAGGVAYSPAPLFAAGEQGAWYDPSDLSTLFKGDAGTDPVTADGDAVSRMLDKSGRGNHATQTTVAKRPLYRTGAGLFWLEFDGTADSMITPSITPGADKMQTFTGLLKTDSAPRMVFETSNNATSNNGSFYVLAGEDNVARYTALGGGTGAASASVRVARLTAASSYPETSVITSTADIAGDSVHIRKNGVEGTAATGDMGTGNFLAFPINIGARQQSQLFLNGNIYQLVIRFGPNLLAGEIDDAETFVAGKAGVTL